MEQDHTPNHYNTAASPQKASLSRLGPQGMPRSPSEILHRRNCSVTFKENTESPVFSKPRRPSTPIPSRLNDPECARDKEAQKSVRRSSSSQDIPQQLRSPGDIARLLPSTPVQYPRIIKLTIPSAIAESLIVPELESRRGVESDKESDRVDDDDIVGDDPQLIPGNDTPERDEEIVVSSEDSSSPIEEFSSGTSGESRGEPRSLKTPAEGRWHPHQLKTPFTTPPPSFVKRAPETQTKPLSRVRLTLYGTPMSSDTPPHRHPTARRYLGHQKMNNAWTTDSMTPASKSHTPFPTTDSTPSQESVLIRTKRPGGYKRTMEKENCDATKALAQDSINDLDKLDTPAAQEESQRSIVSQTPSVKVGATSYDLPPCSRLPFLRSPTDEVQSPISAVLDSSRPRLFPLRARDVNATPERPPKARSIFWSDSCSESSGTPSTQRSKEL